MKTLLHIKKTSLRFTFLFFLFLFLQQTVSAQALSFSSPLLETGADLQIGAQYRFSDVLINVDALVTIEDLVNGAEVREMDNTEGLTASFQPVIYTPGGNGTSYVLFSIKFVEKGTKSPVSIVDFAATSVDIDGNGNLKEFSEITISGASSTVKYTTTTTQISVAPVIGGYRGTNSNNTEYSGVDTTNKLAMYTVKRSNVEDFNIKFGAISTSVTSGLRQHSLYFKDFTYNNFSNNLVTLPVRLYSFTASLTNNKVDLKWVTASEINVNRFIVEKSIDGSTFTTLNTIFANGNTTEKTNYNLLDNININQAGIIYYRLRSVDMDGKSELSDTRIIRISKQVEKAVSIVTYPNPVSNEVRITIPTNWQNKKVVYEIINQSGGIVKRTETTSSSQTEVMNVSNFTSGFYIVRVNQAGQTVQQKIIKQ